MGAAESKMTRETSMKMIVPSAAAAGIVILTIIGSGTAAHSESTAIATNAIETTKQPTPKVELRVKTDEYLVPAHVCGSTEAEMYEDCVPWSLLNESVVLLLPASQ